MSFLVSSAIVSRDLSRMIDALYTLSCQQIFQSYVCHYFQKYVSQNATDISLDMSSPVKIQICDTIRVGKMK